jgi:hypothetical protein
LNPDRRGGKPATNRLSYGAAYPSPYPVAIPTELSWFVWSQYIG